MKKLLLAALLFFSTPAFAQSQYHALGIHYPETDDGSTVTFSTYDLSPSPDEFVDLMKFRSGSGSGSYGVILSAMKVDLNNDGDGDSNEGLVAVLNGLSSGSFSGSYEDLTDVPSTFPSSTHSHAISGVTGLQAALDSKAAASHTHVSDDITDATTVGKNLLTASTQAAARSAIGAGTSSFSGDYDDLTDKPDLFSGDYDDLDNKPSLFSGAWADLTGKPSTFPPSTHGHAIADVSGLQAALDAKQGSIAPGSAIADAATNAATDAPTNASTAAATNLSASSVDILGITVPTNSSYTALVAAHNDLATKYNAAATNLNSAATKYNAAAAKYNDAAAKLNTLISNLEAQGIQTP